MAPGATTPTPDEGQPPASRADRAPATPAAMTSPAAGPAIAHWPVTSAVLYDDGTGSLTINAITEPLDAPTVGAARDVVIERVAAHALNDLGRPVRLSTIDPEGEWDLAVHPDGYVQDLTQPRKTRGPRRATPAKSPQAPPVRPRQIHRRAIAPTPRHAHARARVLAPIALTLVLVLVAIGAAVTLTSRAHAPAHPAALRSHIAPATPTHPASHPLVPPTSPPVRAPLHRRAAAHHRRSRNAHYASAPHAQQHRARQSSPVSHFAPTAPPVVSHPAPHPPRPAPTPTAPTRTPTRPPARPHRTMCNFPPC